MPCQRAQLRVVQDAVRAQSLCLARKVLRRTDGERKTKPTFHFYCCAYPERLRAPRGMSNAAYGSRAIWIGAL